MTVHVITHFAPAAPGSDAAEHASQTAPSGPPVSLTLEQIADACRKAALAPASKGDAGYIIAGACVGSRSADNTGPASLAIVDADDGDPPWDLLAQYEGFGWTTHGHLPGPGGRSAWRFVIPFVEPVAHGALPPPWPGAHIRNRSQPAFLPTHAVSTDLIEWRWLGGTRHLSGEGSAVVVRTGRQDSCLAAAFEAAGWVEREQKGGVVVRCPWVSEHSDGEPGGSVVFYDDPDGLGMGKFSCARTKCRHRTTHDALQVLRAVPAAAAELAHWAPPKTLGGVWTRLEVPQPAPLALAVTDGATAPAVDLSGLNLAPGGWPWVLRQGQWCWLHSLDGERQYSQPIGKADLRLQIKRTHFKAIGLTYIDGKGRKCEKSDREFESEYEQRVSTLRSTYIARTNTWDPPSATLTMAALRWAPLQPVHHADVDEWLRALGGARYPRLAQWLASCLALHRPAPALYIHGEFKVGKSLLARGIARLWGVEPAPFKEALDSFNEAAANCPLMYADEGFPEGMSFNDFREMVTSPSRRVNEKYKPKYAVEGCVRIILSTNNEQALRYQRTGALTAADVQAIGDRLLVVNAGAAARDVLRKHSASSFVDQDKLAQHIHWLAQTVELEPTHERMCAQSDGANDVLDALQGARYGQVIAVVATLQPRNGILQNKAGTWVNVKRLVKACQEAARAAYTLAPREQDIRDFVAAFAVAPSQKLVFEENGNPLHAYPIDWARVQAQASRLE